MGKKRNRSERIRRYFEEQSGCCAYCGEDMTLDLGYGNTATIDHIIPKAVLHIKGEYNEVAACSDCNNYKSDHPLRVVINKLQKGLDNV